MDFSFIHGPLSQIFRPSTLKTEQKNQQNLRRCTYLRFICPNVTRKLLVLRIMTSRKTFCWKPIRRKLSSGARWNWELAAIPRVKFRQIWVFTPKFFKIKVFRQKSGKSVSKRHFLQRIIALLAVPPHFSPPSGDWIPPVLSYLAVNSAIWQRWLKPANLGSLTLIYWNMFFFCNFKKDEYALFTYAYSLLMIFYLRFKLLYQCHNLFLRPIFKMVLRPYVVFFAL